MLRTMVRPVWVGATALALAIPVGVVAQGQGRVRVQAPPVRTAPTSTATRRPTAKEVPVRAPTSRAAGQPSRVDDRRDDDRRDNDRRDDDRWDDRRWDRDRGDVERWTVRSDADLHLFGFLGITFGWDRHDRDDRNRWLERYRRYDARRPAFTGRVDGWFSPSWGTASFDIDPIRFGPRPLDHRDLRQLLDRRSWDRIRREAPGGTSQLWGRVERFGPAGRAVTLEIWSGDRFLAALTDFDRDRWIDDIVVNGRYWR